MNKIFLFFVLALFLCLNVAGQNPLPTPPPIVDETDVIKISTTLIQMDVTVTDKKGNIVTDLKPEDFEIYENGKKQDITNFSFITSNTGEKNLQTPAKEKSEVRKAGIPVPPVRLKPEQVRRTYALVVDDLGLNFASTFWVKESLKKFVREKMQEGDLVAIVRTGRGIGALQSFTSDKRLLMAAIDKIKYNPQGRSGVGTFTPFNTTLKQDVDGIVRADGTVKRVEGKDEEIESQNQIEQFRNENFAVGTLGALNYIIRGMRELPGRKAVMLFSEGFATNRKTTRLFESLRVLADLANRSSVVIYTLDPRGLQVVMYEAQDNPSVREIFDPQIADPLKQRDDDFASSQSSLRYLAYETGGLPFINQNDLDKGLQRAIDDQSGYYLIGYVPDEDTFDPKKSKFNKLEVKLLRPGLEIRYRSGFFGITDEKIQRTAAQTPEQKLTNALISPFGASDISLNLYSVFYNDARNRNFIRSFVYIDPNDLTFKLEPDGLYHTKFNVIAAIFNSNGEAAENGVASQTLKFTKERLESIRKHGIIYDLPIEITKTGAYQFRMAFQDAATGKIGAVSQFLEIPKIKKNLSLSGLLLNGYSAEQWQKIKLGNNIGNEDVLRDTTVRKFKRNTVMRYDYVIYNPNPNRRILSQARLIHDDKIVFEEEPINISTAGVTDLTRLQTAGVLNVGNDLEPGTYILQIVVFEETNPKKFTTQFVEFEVIE